MSLFDKITKWGYEIEYPLTSTDDGYAEDMVVDYDLVPAGWDTGADGGGVEFTILDPLSSHDKLRKEVEFIYSTIDTILKYTYEVEDEDEGVYDFYPFTTTDHLFNSSSAGVHVRLEVDNWNTTERLRFMRLFSNEFSHVSQYADYVSWIANDVFMRGWKNWNYPFNYVDNWRRIEQGDDTPSKTYNVQFEPFFNDGPNTTIEIRGFGVNKNVDDALAQVDSVKLLCDIVDVSMLLEGHARVIDKIYHAFKVVVLKTATVEDWECDQ